MREVFDLEVKYWGLDKGLASIDSLINHEQRDKIEQLLLQQPLLDSKKQMKCLDTWARLGPLTLQEIINSTNMPVDFN